MYNQNPNEDHRISLNYSSWSPLCDTGGGYQLQNSSVLRSQRKTNHPQPKTTLKSIAQRKLQCLLTTPLKAIRVQELFIEVKLKLRGSSLWLNVMREIRLYGTSSNIISLSRTYIRNLPEIMRKKTLQPQLEYTKEIPRFD